MPVRVGREQAYWDEAYRVTGAEHGKYVWTRRVEALSYVGTHFRTLLEGLRGQRVLSLGGGVDALGVTLAQAGNEVVSVDVSPAAVQATVELAEQAGVAENLTALVGAAEDVELGGGLFDAVICKRALHHMDLERVVPRVHALLAPGGFFLAEEPVCLPRWLRWVHAKLPFHPEAPRTEDERELGEEDLELFRRTFGTVEVAWFDLLARESVAYFLLKLRGGQLLYPLGWLDGYLMNRWLPVLRYLATYAVVRAVKQENAGRHET